MRILELVGLVILTIILIGIVLPIPCLPPSCGPTDAVPLTTFEIVQVYLFQPLTMLIIFVWIIAIAVWIRRYRKANDK